MLAFLFCFVSIRFVGMYGAFNSHRLFAFNFYSLDPLLFSTHAILFADAIANCYYVLHNTESIHIVEAVKGTIGRLPCNITPSVKGDKIILVIWYKDGYSLPIYR